MAIVVMLGGLSGQGGNALHLGNVRSVLCVVYASCCLGSVYTLAIWLRLTLFSSYPYATSVRCGGLAGLCCGWLYSCTDSHCA